MEIFTSNVPIWVSILFVLTFPIAVFLMANVGFKAAQNARMSPSKATNIHIAVVAFFFLYMLYVSLLSLNGVFAENVLPPKIFLYTTLPLMIFLFGFVFNSKLFQMLKPYIDLDSLIRIHAFRFVGVFFLIAYFYEALPAKFALMAGIGDILAAIGSLFVANLIDKKTASSYKIALIWNIFGFWDIVSVIISALIHTKMALENHTIGLAEMAKFPFAWIAAFAPAVIIFLHIVIFKKLKVYRTQMTQVFKMQIKKDFF